MNATNFFSFCPSNPELFVRLIPDTDDVKQLSKLCLVNKTFRDFMFSTLPGRSTWLSAASKVTGYDGSKIIDVRVSDFQYQIKLLVCPWLSTPTPLHFEYPEETFSFRMKINPIGKSRLLFRLVVSNDDEDQFTEVDEVDRIFSFCSLPCKSKEMFDKTLRQLPNSLIDTFNQTIDERETKYKYHGIVPILTENTGHIYKQINKTTYAVIETIDSEHCMGYSEGGVYFISNRDPENPRMLRHLKHHFMNCSFDADICSIPQTIWLASSDCISYFGPKVEGEKELICDKEDSLIGRMTPAMWMAYEGRALDAINFMRDEMHGLDINTKSQMCGRTLLHYAVYGDQADCIEELVRVKADVNLKDARANSPLMMAACRLDAKCIRMLCKYGADINTTGAYMNTPLLCMRFGSRDYKNTDNIIQVLEALIENGANLNHVNTHGETILFSTSIAFNSEIIGLLVSHGADPMHRNNAGNTVLHTCFKEFDTSAHDIARTLVKEYKLDINSKNNEGLTTLSLNVFILKPEDFRLLVVELGADTTVKTSHGMTLLDAMDLKYFQESRAENKQYREICQILNGSG